MSHITITQGDTPGRIVSNAGVLFATALASRALRVAISMVVAHHLGLAEYGILAFIVAYVEIFRVISDFGIDTALTRRLAASEGAPALMGSAAVIKSLLALAAYALGAGGAAIAGYPQSRVQMLAVGLFGLFLSSGSTLCAAPFQAALRTRLIAWTGVVATGVYVLLAIAGVHTGEGILYFIVAGLIAELSGFALAAAVLHRHVRLAWMGWRQTWDLLRSAVPIGLTSIMAIGYGRLGMLLLDRRQGAGEVGMYAVGLRLTEILVVLAAALAGSTFPAMARLLEQRQMKAMNVLYQTLYRKLVSGIAAIVLLFVFFGPLALRLIGSEFVPASQTLAVLAWTSVFISANQMSAALLLAAGRGNIILALAAWNLVLNIALNILLIPSLGAVGVAIALLGTESQNMILQSLIVWKQFQIAPAVGLWFRVTTACGIVVGYLMARVPSLTFVVLALHVATAWHLDVATRGLQPRTAGAASPGTQR